MEREIAEKQLQQQRANGFLQAGMFLLTRPPPSSPQTVIIQQRPAQPVYYPPTILFPK
jgi:hypothetical protein